MEQGNLFFSLLFFFFIKPVEEFTQYVSKSSFEVISLTKRLVLLILRVCILTVFL